MAIAFDAQVTPFPAYGGGFTSPLQLNNNGNSSTITIGASATALVAILAFAVTTGSLPVCTGMTWNSVAMSQIATKVESDNLASVYIFGLVSPSTGSHVLAATFTGSTTNAGAYLDAVSWTGTDTSSNANAFPAANVVTDASTPGGTTYPTGSFTVTTVSGDMVIGCANNEAFSPWTGVTAGTFLNGSAAATGNFSDGYNAAAGTSTTLQFTGGPSGTPCCGAAIRITQPASLTLQGFQPRRFMRDMMGWRRKKGMIVPEPAWQMKKAA